MQNMLQIEFSDANNFAVVVLLCSASIFVAILMKKIRRSALAGGYEELIATKPAVLTWLLHIFSVLSMFVLNFLVSHPSWKGMCRRITETIFQFFAVLEMQFLLVETISNLVEHKKSHMSYLLSKAKIALYVLGTSISVVIPSLPGILRTDERSSDFLPTPRTSHLKNNFVVNITAAQPQTEDSASDNKEHVVTQHADIFTVTDPLPLVQPQVSSEEKIAKAFIETMSPEAQNLDVVSNFTNTWSKQAGLTPQYTLANVKDFSITSSFHQIPYVSSKTSCVMEWTVVSIIDTLIVFILITLFIFLLAGLEFRELKLAERRGKVVPLIKWFFLISRPFVGVIATLKWTAITFFCDSTSNILPFIIIWFVTPFITCIIAMSHILHLRNRVSEALGQRYRVKKALLRNKRKKTISRVYLTGDVGYKNHTSFSDIMLQVQEPALNRASNDVLQHESFNEFSKEHTIPPVQQNPEATLLKDEENSLGVSDESNWRLGVSERNDQIPSSKCDTVDVTASLLKCNIAERSQPSFFDDNEYDKVIEFMTSQQHKQSDAVLEARTEDEGLPRESDDTANSSKRSSASSVSISSDSTSRLSATSGIESGEERSTSKYANLDIAKILHTRKRIHKILQVSIDSSIEKENQEKENQTFSTKKKTTNPTKRHTHYGTVGSSKHKTSLSTLRRYSSSSRPPSTGDELSDYSTQRGDCSTLDILRWRKGENGDSTKEGGKVFTYDPKTDRLRSRDSESDDEIIEKRKSDGYERKRWSRLSSNSQNGEKANQTPQKGPWKAFRKFVNKTDSLSRSQEQGSIKATTVLQRNENNNNHKSENVIEGRVGNFDIPRKTTEKFEEAPDHSSPTSIASPPTHRTSSLLRRLSRRSSSRGRSARRKSMPSQSVTEGSLNDDKQKSTQPRKDSSLPRFQYGDGSHGKGDIETMVMASVTSRVNKNAVKEDDKSQKPMSFRKRIMSFTRRRSFSRERKSILKPKTETTSSDSTQITKALSYSSPQLSVFAVNSGPTFKGNKQELVF